MNDFTPVYINCNYVLSEPTKEYNDKLEIFYREMATLAKYSFSQTEFQFLLDKALSRVDPNWFNNYQDDRNGGHGGE